MPFNNGWQNSAQEAACSLLLLRIFYAGHPQSVVRQVTVRKEWWFFELAW
jgi:hypothetical protein